MIDIYLLFVEDFQKCNLEAFENYLSAEEKEKRTKFVFQKDRDQYLLTRTLVRKILAQRLGVPFSTLNFGKNEYGKPYLQGFPENFAFNISHSSGLIALALIQNADTIGIDVERIDRKLNIDIRDTVFTPEEIQNQLALEESKQQEAFFELWTLKESYMKAIGKGFSLSPKSFRFILGKEQRKFHENPTESNPEQFAFQLFTVNSSYNLAVCHPREMNEINTFRVLPYWEISRFEIQKRLAV
jgi:4'-phosphopantetheinyl transferase